MAYWQDLEEKQRPRCRETWTTVKNEIPGPSQYSVAAMQQDLDRKPTHSSSQDTVNMDKMCGNRHTFLYTKPVCDYQLKYAHKIQEGPSQTSLKFFPTIRFGKQVARDKIAELKEQFSVMNAKTQNARDRKRDAAINKCLKDQENEIILQKYRTMPWMLPKELEMFGSHKEYNKRSAHHPVDQ